MSAEAKRIAGEAAAALVEDGMRVGLGTGSTTAFAIAELGRRVQQDGLRMIGTPTSFAAERLARQHGVPLATLDDLDGPNGLALDLALDGADEVDAALNLIKGRGAAHTREKVVAALADRFVVLIDPSKEVERLGTKMPVPIEVVPMAVAPVVQALERFGASVRLRAGQQKDGPVVTDQGLWVLDATFAYGVADPTALDQALLALPGVLDHGLFLGLATDVLIGHDDGEVEHRTR
ncbi:MAG: ribose 5-phosphate isomerase A [Bacteroidota bacterium]